MNRTTYEDIVNPSTNGLNVTNTSSALDSLSASVTTGNLVSMSSPTDHGKLEDYIVEIQNRQNEPTEATMEADCDLQTQLAKKEKDLIFAAELGKALLERNEELTRTNERITEEYSHKLEVRYLLLLYFLDFFWFIFLPFQENHSSSKYAQKSILYCTITTTR